MTDFIKGITPIPPRNQVVDQHEWLNIHHAASKEVYTYGVFSKELEARLSAYTDNKLCLLCNSGSSANLLAVSALTSDELGSRRLVKGDEVITTALSFPTTVNPIIQNGLTPVFVDIQLPYYTPIIDFEDFQKAAILTHMFGNPITTERFSDWLILDCCDALGSSFYRGDINTFSFYPAHHITMGEGGACVTNDPQLYKVMRSFRDWGRSCWCEAGQDNKCGHRFDGDYDHKYTYSHIGYNLKSTELNAAIGVAQFGKLPSFVEARKQNFRKYYNGLKDLEDVFILPEPSPGTDPSWFGFPLVFRDRPVQDFCRVLEEKYKIANRRMFAGNVLRQPAYKNIQHRIIGNLDNTNMVMDSGFWLFLSPSLTGEMMEYVLEVIHAEVK